MSEPFEEGQRVRILAVPRNGQEGVIAHQIHFLLSDTWLCFVTCADGEIIPYYAYELEAVKKEEV